MATEPDWKAYERQIFERLRARAAPDACITFDDRGKQRMPGRLSGVRRQIDVIVKGRFAGLDGERTMIVDCKCFTRPLDVTHVEAFGGLVEDVGAELGLLVTTEGFSAAAQRRAESYRGVNIDVVELDDLAEWIPRKPTVGITRGGTATLTYRDRGGIITESVSPELAWRLINETARAARRSTLEDEVGRDT